VNPTGNGVRESGAIHRVELNGIRQATVSEKNTQKRPKRKRPELSLREIRFAEQYVECGVATDAYRAAGYPERSDQSTRVLAFHVLRNPAVQKLIHTLRQEACDAARVSINRLAQGLARIAFANRADLFDERGCLLPADQWPPDIAATVESVESEEVYETVAEEGQPKRKQLRGHVRKVHTARRAEAMKVLAQWRRMIGRDSEIESMGRELERLRALLEQVRGQQGGEVTG
jgi:phage terminase small subunit